MKGNKGITLIALIITIIVMLILVVVSVTAVLNGGLFTKAKDAAGKTRNEVNSELALDAASAVYGGKTIDEWTDISSTTENELKEMHTITWNLTNIKTEGLPTEIEDGATFDITLTPEEGYFIPWIIDEQGNRTLYITGNFESEQDGLFSTDYYSVSGLRWILKTKENRIVVPGIVKSDITVTLSATTHKPVKAEVSTKTYIIQTYEGFNTWPEFVQQNSDFHINSAMFYIDGDRIKTSAYDFLYYDTEYSNPVLSTDTITDGAIYYEHYEYNN